MEVSRPGETILGVNKNAYGVGVAAVQVKEGKLYPVGYASKKFSIAEANISIIEKDCLAVVLSIRTPQVLSGWQEIHTPD